MNAWRSIINTENIKIVPNEHGDWLNQRLEEFETFIPIEPDEKLNHNNKSFFLLHSSGLKTNRDPWCYNSSENGLIRNIEKTIYYYNDTLEQFKESKAQSEEYKKTRGKPQWDIKEFIDYDSTEISWTDNIKQNLIREITYEFDEESIVKSMYRLFFKQQCYFNRLLNDRVNQLPKIFPTEDIENLVICVVGKGEKLTSFPLITDLVPDLHIISTTQCVPLYYQTEYLSEGLILSEMPEKQCAITDFILREYQKLDKDITKEDIFYSVYGFLHSRKYLKKYAADLKRSLPRIPLLTKKDFWSFSKAGRQLADLHLNYETIGAPDGVIVEGEQSGRFEVQKMKFTSKNDKSAIAFNNYITVKNIPEEAYEYVLNERSAIEWVMRNYQIKIDSEDAKILQWKTDVVDFTED